MKLSESQKQELIKKVLGNNYHTAGNRLPVLRDAIDLLGDFNDAAAIAELLPYFSKWLSIPAVSSVASNASFIGVLAFPFVQSINLVNANETGLMMYSFRSAAYTICAWAFNKPIPTSSPRIKSNATSGSIVATKSPQEYDKVWLETSANVRNKLQALCINNNIDANAMKKIYRAIGRNREDQLCLHLLKGFQEKIPHTAKNVWKSNYRTLYPY